MPHLTKEQLEQVKFVSIQDYCQRVDKIENLGDKLAFTTRYILSYDQINNGEVDQTIEDIIKVAHMKIADKSADLKEFYLETDVNRGRAELMVDPTVEAYDNDIGNQMFIANPVGYLKGQAKVIEDEIKAKDWKSQADIQMMAACGQLRNRVFTDEFGAKIVNGIKKPTAFDVKARLENAYGGPAALKKAYEKTKPGVFSRMFDTSSLAAKHLDTAYQAFQNPNHALHGNLPTIEKAATEYLQHVLPDYKPNRLKNIPTMEDIARLSGTKKARALLSINLLNAVKAQKTMESDYQDMLKECENKNLSFNQIPSKQEAPAEVQNEQAYDVDRERSNSFQAQLEQDVLEGEPQNRLNYSVDDLNVENQVETDGVALD